MLSLNSSNNTARYIYLNFVLTSSILVSKVDHTIRSQSLLLVLNLIFHTSNREFTSLLIFLDNLEPALLSQYLSTKLSRCRLHKISSIISLLSILYYRLNDTLTTDLNIKLKLFIAIKNRCRSKSSLTNRLKITIYIYILFLSSGKRSSFREVSRDIFYNSSIVAICNNRIIFGYSKSKLLIERLLCSRLMLNISSCKRSLRLISQQSRQSSAIGNTVNEVFTILRSMIVDIFNKRQQLIALLQFFCSIIKVFLLLSAGSTHREKVLREIIG